MIAMIEIETWLGPPEAANMNNESHTFEEADEFGLCKKCGQPIADSIHYPVSTSIQNSRKCGTCVFGKHIVRASYVRCMRFPPTIDPETSEWIRPDMSRDDWCGEWQSGEGERILK